MSIIIDIFLPNTRFVNMRGIQRHWIDHVDEKAYYWLYDSKISLKFPWNEKSTNCQYEKIFANTVKTFINNLTCHKNMWLHNF